MYVHTCVCGWVSASAYGVRYRYKLVGRADYDEHASSDIAQQRLCAAPCPQVHSRTPQPAARSLQPAAAYEVQHKPQHGVGLSAESLASCYSVVAASSPRSWHARGVHTAVENRVFLPFYSLVVDPVFPEHMSTRRPAL